MPIVVLRLVISVTHFVISLQCLSVSLPAPSRALPQFHIVSLQRKSQRNFNIVSIESNRVLPSARVVGLLDWKDGVLIVRGCSGGGVCCVVGVGCDGCCGVVLLCDAAC